MYTQARINATRYVICYLLTVADLYTVVKCLKNYIVSSFVEIVQLVDNVLCDLVSDIYHRILRFKNYMVAMVNKSLLPLQYRVPFVGERYLVTYMYQIGQS